MPFTTHYNALIQYMIATITHSALSRTRHNRHDLRRVVPSYA